MSEDEFWRIVGVGGATGGDLDAKLAGVAHRLSKLSEGQRQQFGRTYDELDRAAFRWDIWGAAYVVNRGCSDDGFDYFRAWLISQGQTAFQSVLADPDTLVKFLDGDDREQENEDFLGLAREALGDLELPPFPAEPQGKAWDFDDEHEMLKRYPRLSEIERDWEVSDAEIRELRDGALKSFAGILSHRDAATDAGPGPFFESEAVEGRVRELVVAFMKSDEFGLMFSELHPGKVIRALAKGIGLFHKRMRQAARTIESHHRLASPELRQAYLTMAERAPIVFAPVVMANRMMIEEGNGSAALVVLAWDPVDPEVLSRARSVLSRVHFDTPENDRERELAELIEDEEYCFGRRRRLPDWLVGDREAYAADLWVAGDAVDLERLRMEVVVCFAEPGPDGLIMAIPGRFLDEAMKPLDPKASPPPLPPSAGPPPLPGGRRPPPFPPEG